MVDPNDPAIVAESVTFSGPVGDLLGYLVQPLAPILFEAFAAAGTSGARPWLVWAEPEPARLPGEPGAELPR